MPRIHVDLVSRDLYILRVDDSETKFFEALWEIPEGITYNAYLLTTSEGAILFDTWKAKYSEELVESIRRVVDPRDIVYVVVHHMEQDHSGSLPRVLQAADASSVTVVGHPMVKDMVSSFYGIDLPRFKPIKDGDSLELGGYRIRFLHTPWLHWPETTMSFIENLGALLSCDAFGAYSVPKTLFDDGVGESYMRFVRKYVATVIGYYIRFVARNIEKISSLGLDIRIVAPSHGVVWRANPRKIIDYYYRLSKGQLVDERKVTLIYSSMYGAIASFMKMLYLKLRSKGFDVHLYAFTDSSRAALADAIGDAIDSALIVVGVPTYEAGMFPLMKLVLELLAKKIRLGNRIAVVTCYGWGSPRRAIEEVLKGSSLQLLKIVEFRGRASAEHVEEVARLAEGGGQK
ncbi:MAG: FprA family A-type flavoprotein [Crenarchaeota archaeon]|nr:FprA family A-type flavoprotein [Thermoproteota archaeon]